MPQTRYARNGDVSIAYQVVGSGPDLVYVPSWVSQVEHLWAHPRAERLLSRIASFSRLIMFDRRGSGLSDRVEPGPLEVQVDDVRAVMRSAGAARATIWAETEGTAMAALFAATHPQLTTALALFNPIPRVVRDDDYAWAADPDMREQWIMEIKGRWGDGSYISFLAPSLADDSEFCDWCARLERLACGPGAVPAALKRMGENDVRSVLPSIGVPTLVVRRADDHWLDERHAQYVLDHVPNARLQEVPGSDPLVVAGDVDSLTDALEEFVTGTRRARSQQSRALATVLFTDIADSTRRAAELGDAPWAEVIEDHKRLVRSQLARYAGVEVKTLGDGFLARFDGPARAVRCAAAIVEGSAAAGIGVRAGAHTGEVDLTGGDVTGIAVHIASRVIGHAAPGEVVVSRTVVDLVAGSELQFEPRGTHELKGVPGEWQLYAAVSAEAAAA
jgi:class 3 adenylate cyclase